MKELIIFSNISFIRLSASDYLIKLISLVSLVFKIYTQVGGPHCYILNRHLTCLGHSLLPFILLLLSPLFSLDQSLSHLS